MLGLAQMLEKAARVLARGIVLIVSPGRKFRAVENNEVRRLTKCSHKSARLTSTLCFVISLLSLCD